MLIYYLNLTLILSLGLLLCEYKPTVRKKAVYLCVTFGFLLFLATARYNIGNDYRSYIEIYENVANTPMGELFSLPYEKGYVVLCKLLALLGLSNTAMYFVMALCCLLPVAWFIWRYSPNIWLSTWLYVTLTFFYGIMNFVRQNLAVAVLLLGYPLLKSKRRFVPFFYLGVIVLACLFHKTALIMLPVFFLCLIPLRRSIGITYTAVAVVLYLTSDYLLDFITRYIYQYYRGSIYLELGFGLHFLVIPALILLLLLLTRRLVERRFEAGGLIVNMMLFNFLIWLFITKHFILERFSLYIYIFVLLAVPMACECLKPEEKQRVLYAELQQEIKGLKTGPKTPAYKKKTERLRELRETVVLRGAYYYCLVGAVLIATLCYNIFGMYDGSSGFHGVFPYRSWIGFLNQLP